MYDQPYGHILRMEAVLDAMVKIDNANMRREEARRNVANRAEQAKKEEEANGA